eukprot:4045278-Amphidinium_carterae.2
MYVKRCVVMSSARCSSSYGRDTFCLASQCPSEDWRDHLRWVALSRTGEMAAKVLTIGIRWPWGSLPREACD